jgi:hypothetical protein
MHFCVNDCYACDTAIVASSDALNSAFCSRTFDINAGRRRSTDAERVCDAST